MSDENKVSEISKARQKKRSSGEIKPTAGSKEQGLLCYLEGHDYSEILPGMGVSHVKQDWHIYFYCESPMEPARILRHCPEADTYEEIGKDELVREINRCLDQFGSIEGRVSSMYCLSDREASSLANRLLKSGRRIKSWPLPIGFKSQKGHFFQRFDFDLPESATKEDFPTINLNLQGMTNSTNFCQRVGSLYDPDADRKQVIVMVGDTDGGKSALIDLLTYLAGGLEGIASVDEGVFGEFGLAPLVDKRVWIAEEIPAKFFARHKFKTLTGGTGVMINRKGEKQFNAYLTGMMFATSNKTLKIPNDSGFRSRLIICEVEPIPKELRLPRPDTRRRMTRELPAFIRYCIEQYEFVGGDGTLTPETTEALDGTIEDAEAEMEAVFDAEFVAGDPLKLENPITSSEYCAWWESISKASPEFARRTTKGRFDEYVKQRLGIKRLSKRISQGGSRCRVVPGLTFKKGGKYG